jgi:hypothetical protein
MKIKELPLRVRGCFYLFTLQELTLSYISYMTEHGTDVSTPFLAAMAALSLV